MARYIQKISHERSTTNGNNYLNIVENYFQCEVCGKEYSNHYDAIWCERSHRPELYRTLNVVPLENTGKLPNGSLI